ncbi:MAG: T9SS type A sorting domain-containing protein [bacterium]|nr:T9SS type A sorting domain-containing protein [bacterium]
MKLTTETKIGKEMSPMRNGDCKLEMNLVLTNRNLRRIKMNKFKSKINVFAIALFAVFAIFCGPGIYAQETDTLFFDDFENGLGNWMVSGQDWGTDSLIFSSSTHSITDSPGGNYPQYSNATITLAYPIDLSSSNAPVLKFWHKYFVRNGSDYCHVEISEDGGYTWVTDTSFTGYVTTLIPVQIDLSDYSTSTILIRFRLRDHGDSYTYDGWYIDDVEITETDVSQIPFPFSDDFENGLDNWLVSGQDWGTDTLVYSSSTHSITDSPGGNYPQYSNTTITLAHPIDLSSSNAPVLKFWHKYFVRNGSDYCHVEISEDGGFTWITDTSFTGYVTTLVPVQIDLSGYSASSILVRFRLRDHGDSYTYDGWYIDDVEITEMDVSQTPFPFSDDFENGLDNWLVSGQDWGTDTLTFSSTTHSITDSPEGNYPQYSNATITLAYPIDLSSSSAPVLKFWHKYFVRNGSDYCHVEISEDGGYTWVTETSFTGYVTTLIPVQIDLSEYGSSPILVRFRLRDHGDSYTYSGWYIDDVEITEMDVSQTPFPFFDDFENGLDNWLVSGQDWDTVTCGDSNHCITDSPRGNYPQYSNATITLAHPIDLSSSNAPVLKFWHKYFVRNGSDYCHVEISEDGGYTWVTDTSFTGYVTTLVPVQIDLSDYSGSSILIRFRLRDHGDSYTYDGWCIDDVEIKDMLPDITGLVRNSDDQEPIYSVHIQLSGIDTLDTWTNRQGRYSVGSVISGTYNVSFSHELYRDTVIYDVEISDQGTIQLDVDLYPLPISVDDKNDIPQNFSLSRNYPNPFNPSTTISYAIPERSNVRLEIFNVIGQRIDVLVDDNQSTGEYAVTWDASNYSSGVYFYRLTTGNHAQTKRMTLVK